jgi:hypothetical protein
MNPIESAQLLGAALPRGSRLQEFEVESLIGKGGFSIVYRARDTQLGRTVALKEYLPAAIAQRSADHSVAPLSQRHGETFELGLRSFVNEARLLASFDHPSLVKVHRFWEGNGTAYMAMPLYHGPTLAEWLRVHDAPPTEAWLRALLAPLLDALELIHASSCWHRDIAPDNILLLDRSPAGEGDDDAPQPVLLDFGAARRVIGDATQDLTVILKPGFAPIEQYAQGTLTRQGPWTDLYALCALLYRALTGRTPVASVVRVMHDEHEPAVSAARGLCSPAFLRAIDAGMALQPQQRPQSVAAWRALLEAEVPTISVVAPPVRPADDLLPTVLPTAPAVPQPPQQQQRRASSRWPTVTAALAALSAIGAGAWYAAQPSRSPSPPSPAAPAAVQAPVAAEPSPPAAAPAVAPPAEATPAAPPFSVLGALNDIVQGADGTLQIDVRADKTTLAIGRDALRLRVRSSSAGYVYLFTGGTAKSHFYLLFPNRLDRDNRIEAGQEITLPRPSWQVTAGGPPGVNPIVVMVSRQPRDLGATGLQAAGHDIPQFDLEQAARRWAQRGGAGSPFVGTVTCPGSAGGAACDPGYGARLIEIVEAAR